MFQNTQQRVERSIFEVLRKEVVRQGYLPNIEDSVRYPAVDGKFTTIAQENWEADINVIVANKGWALEIFGTSSAFAKGLKRTPRVVIVPKRIMPGDIGMVPGFDYENYGDPNNPWDYNKFPLPDTSANMHFDIHLISSSQQQSRFLNMLISTMLGIRKYIPFEDNNKDYFFIKHYNYYDISDTNDGMEENVYSYEVQDLYLFPDADKVRIKPITEITTDITVVDGNQKMVIDNS
jgi:hypothetical protein